MRSLLAVGFTCLFAFTASAEDKKEAPKYSGAWVKEADGGVILTLTFVKEGELTFKVEAPDASIVMYSTYTVEKDGTIKTKLTKKEIKGEFPFNPKDDFTYEFKIKVEKDSAAISDFKASEHEDEGKGAVEGKYKKKEAK